jgi:hypothetical protein
MCDNCYDKLHFSWFDDRVDPLHPEYITVNCVISTGSQGSQSLTRRAVCASALANTFALRALQILLHFLLWSPLYTASLGWYFHDCKGSAVGSQSQVFKIDNVAKLSSSSDADS